MIKFETIPDSESLGTIKRNKDGTLDCSTPAIQDIVNGLRKSYRLTDAKVYEYFAKGAYDNGYVRAVEV